MNPSNLSRDQLTAELLGQVPLELVEPGQAQLELPLQARDVHGELHAESLLHHRLDRARELLLLAPSRADEHLTQMPKSALSLCDVRGLDHLIVVGDRIVSMAELGLI